MRSRLEEMEFIKAEIGLNDGLDVADEFQQELDDD
jgi:hypothetical protein